MRKATFLIFLLFSSLFSGMSAGVMQEIRDGNDYDDEDYSNHRKIIDCTATSSSPCDDSDSVVVGAHNYNSGNNQLIYELNLNGIAECIDSDMELSIDLQTNGPNNIVYGGVTNYGWVGGQQVHENSTAQFRDMSKVVIYAHDWDGNPSSAPSDWDIIDANSKVKFQTGSLGTISTTNRGTGFFVEEINLPKDGTVNLTGRTGTYLKTDTATSGVAATTSTLKIKVLNDPQTDWTNANTHLRTEIRSVTVEYDNETVAPSNPSGNWTTSGSDSGFIDNAWTRVRKFTFTKDNAANDECQFDHLDYVILPNGTNPNTAQSLNSYSVTNNKTFSNVWVPPASTAGTYKFWYRAVDSLGNEAQWVTDSGFEILYDRVAPVAGVTTVNYSSTIPWFSDLSLPSLGWSGWTDAHATIKNYSLSYDGSAPHVTGISNSTASWTASSSAGLTCGPHTFKLNASDHALPVANNRFVTVPFNFDNCAPNPASISLPSSNWYNSNSPSVDFSSASETSSVQSGIDHCELFVNGQSQGVMNSNLCTSQTASRSINLLDGSYTGHMRTCDVAGNCANSTEEFIRVDTISPSLQAITLRSPTADIWGTDSSLNLTLSFTDTNPGNTTISQMSQAYAIVVPSSQVPTVSQVKNGSHYIQCQTNSCPLDISRTLTDGNWSVWYLAYDQAGNVLGPNKVSSAFLVDTTPPSSTTPYFAANMTNLTSMTVLWAPSFDAGSSVSNYYLNLTNTDSMSDTPYFIGPNTSHLITGLVDGNYSACLVPVDSAGNHGSRTCTTTSLWVDSTAPLLQAWTNVEGWTSSNQVTISWLAEDASQTAEVRYTLDNGTQSMAFPANHSVVLSSLSAGIHQVRVVANDSAGNSVDVLLSFGIDPTPPVIQAQHLPGQSWTNQTTHAISWNITDSLSGVSNVALFLNGVLVQDNVSVNGMWNYTLGSGTHNITIVATNDVGLNSTWTSIALVDSATPSLTCSVYPNTWTSTTPSFYFDVQVNGSVSNVVYLVEYDGNLMNVPTPGTVNLPNSLDGYHNVTVEASNLGGNTVHCKLPVYIDTTAPSLLSYPQFPNVLNSSEFTLSLDLFDTHSAVSSVEISVAGVLISDSAEMNSYPLNFSSFQDGEYDLQVKIFDHALNELHWNTTFVLDRTVPLIESFTLESSTLNGWLNQSTAEVNVFFSDLIDSEPTGVFVVNGVEYPASQGANYLPLNNGLNPIQLIVSDHGDLTSLSTLDIHVDTIVPQCLLTGDVASNVWSKDLIRNLSNVVSSGPSGYIAFVEINGLSQGEIGGSVLVELENGSNQISAIVASEAGLSSTCTLQQLVDAQPDPMELEIATSIGQYGDGIVSLRLHGSAGDLSPGVARLLIDGVVSENFSYAPTLDETYFIELETGSHTLSVKTMDEAGNTWQSQSQIVSVLIDDLPPEVACKFQTNGGTTVLNPDAEMNPLLFAGGSKKIQCFVEDFQGNPIDFLEDIGEVSIRYDRLPMGTLLGLDITQNGFDLSLADDEIGVAEPHELFIVVRDMWGNAESQTYNLMFMRADRGIEMICIDEMKGDEICEISYPLVDGTSDDRLTFQAKQFIHIEPGFEWLLLSENQPLTLSSVVGFEGTMQSTSNNIIQVYVLDLLRDNNLSFDERNRIAIQLHAITTYGQIYATSVVLEFKQCPTGYTPNHGDMKCVADTYLGPDLTWTTPEDPLPRNTTQVQFNVLTNEAAKTEITSTCLVDGREIPIPAGVSELSVSVNNTVKSIQFVCTDENGFDKSMQRYDLIFVPPQSENEGFLGSISPVALIGGGAGALLVLLVVGVMLMRKKDGARSQDVSQTTSSETQAFSQIPTDELPEPVPDVLQEPTLLSSEDDFETLLLEAESDTSVVTKPLEFSEGD
jgi:hypothetical protein